jgi:hypothetical protein
VVMENDNGDADDLGSGWFEVKKVSFYACLIFSCFLCLALMIFSYGSALCLMILTVIVLNLP